MATDTAVSRTAHPVSGHSRNRWVFHALMTPFTLLWIAPMVFVLAVAFRSFDDIASRGLGALPASFTFDGFATALDEGSIGRALANSALVTVVGVVATLFLASLAAFALSRHAIPFRRTILLTMLAGNLLPPQILLIPVSSITETLGIYDSLFALIVVQVAFGMGFYTFVLHGFMRSIPNEIVEAAVVDGAGSARIYARIIVPLSRPALAALAALATTWIFNDLIWALTVLRTEEKFPITMALLNLQGGFVSNWNVVASGAVLAAIPTAVVFFAFQKHFVSGLLVGANK
ncbi:carbohydrate ABC transporter membrane protein 2 (CUT1 family) [Haloactinopolyspora alba]|uniref:Carbohydrate ABC transporter membrane protein 2 (CUT1 family) n=2 Tax=Haloactinopolyspora alba TaxID=648780 RepID=A0A2P8EG99_9ACTN|nr:carbohydrate ABC transporter permease [Haloactinopolyspora alba]PSL08490.1 carbohydrate ABC transporter membrane protein 2 (CUT1 family) [Haloactinopolyspora alba]